MFEHDKFDYFIQIRPTPGLWGFSNYPDTAGSTYQAYQNFNELNSTDSKKFYINWSVRERTYRTSKNREILVSINGGKPKMMKLKDFIANSPWTEGSPNLRGEPIIKLYDEIKDAAVAVDRKERRLEAGNAALSLKNSPEKLAVMAHLIGCYQDNKQIQLSRVLEFADQDPETFLKNFHSDDSDALATVKKGLASGVLKKKGKMITWESTTIGADMDDAVASLMKDQEKHDALKKAIKKLK